METIIVYYIVVITITHYMSVKFLLGTKTKKPKMTEKRKMQISYSGSYTTNETCIDR